MNIFATSLDPAQCAKDHCDVLLRKMVVENMQLLSTAHVELDEKQVAYKSTHKNHPSALFVRKERSNYQWAYELAVALCNEYTYRTGKIHKSSECLEALKHPPRNIPNSYGKRTFIPKCMPDEFKQKSVEDSYKAYLNAKFAEWCSRDKPVKVEWSKREVPSWVAFE